MMDDTERLDLFGTGTPCEDETPVPTPPPMEEEAAEPIAAEEPAVEQAADQEDTVQEAPTEESAAASPDQWGAVMEMQQQVMESIGNLAELFNKRIMHAEHEDKVIDRMHAELQKYKEDLYAQLVRPILLELIEIRESILRIAQSYREKPEGQQDIPNQTFADYAMFDLQDILENNGVTIYKSESGDSFAPMKQRVIKKVPTADESLHGKVAQSLSCGYEYNGRVIAAEKIAVYLYEQSVEQTAETNNSEVDNNG